MRRFLTWLQAHPVVALIAALITFVCGVNVFENWRAERRWQSYCADARARGVRLLLTEFARPEIPEEENFAMIPMLRTAFAGGGNDLFNLPNLPNASAQSIAPAGFNVSIGNGPPSLGDAIKGEEVKWIEWQKYFQAVGFLSKISEDPIRDTLRGLEHFRPQFQEWSEWRTRSACRFPLDLKMGVAMPLPHLIVFSRAARIFTVQMRAHLALGDSAAAYADFQEGFQAYRALEKEPTLTCGLGRALTLTILFSQVGHGLRERTWAESELKKIEADLASIRVWEDYRLGMASERGSCNGMMDQLANASSVKRAQMIGVWGGVGPGNMNGSTALSTLMWTLIQKRVFRDNQLRQNQHFDELLARLDSADTRLDLDRAIPSGPEKLANAFDRYYYFFLRITGSIYSKVEQRYLALKTQLEETRLASALERFRIAHGAYPETLSELVPDFLPRLPQDPYADAPLIYRRVEGGTFLLYSVGRNRVDDGGKIDPQKPEKGQADAVWLYAPPP